MTCRACNASLPGDARFCPACGTPVERSCGSCGAALPDGARFCPRCGAPADAAPADAGPAAPTVAAVEDARRPTRSRKVATLLFADLVGYTGLGERHDPEVVGAVVGEVFGRLSQEVARYEGTIEKFAGDAMLAVFGVPAIHEDDPERAVRAALEMQVAMAELAARARARGGPEPELRIGLETGEVLVDETRAAAERDLFVTGDAVNTAARLQQAAAPGSVVVGPAAYAATRHIVEYEELPTATLKGKQVPVAAWRAVAVKARRGGRRAPLGIEAPIVGRDEELNLLKETVRRAVADGRPHLVTVVGAAGVGKSRLTWELEKYLDGLPETYHWRKGRCLAYAQASYSGLADVIKADARIMDDDAPATAMAKLDERIAEVHGTSPDPSIAEALRAVLALGPLATVARETLFEAWRRHLDAVARLAPLVLVLEDIHWADEGLLDVIEFLARWGEGPMTILCLARHELLERRPSWGGGTLNASTIVLEPLDAGETSRLVDTLVGSALPPELRDRIVELADGNPLFAEELVRMFVDRGVLRFGDGQWELARPVAEIEVPGSVQAVLAARLDNLPDDEKRLAQNAAVVGRIFWDAVLAHLSRQGPAVTSDLLRRLRVKELVVPREPSALAGAAEFGFRHVLIRDVAYDSLPKRDRATLHLSVARWAEDALGERREEFVELLAAHYVAGLRYEEEFGTDPARLERLRERTLQLAREAAHHAHRLGQSDSAARWIRTAIEQARKTGIAPVAFAELVAEYLELGYTNESGVAAAPIVEEALRRLEQPDAGPVDPELRARLEADAGRTLYMAQRADEAQVVLEAALASTTDPSARVHLLHSRGWLAWRLGRVAEAVPILEEAMELARSVGNDRLFRLAMHDLGIASAVGNDPRGPERVRESFALAKAAGDVNLVSRGYINLPSILLANGDDWGEILPLLDEGLDRARRRVDLMTLSWVCGNYAELLWYMGRVRDAHDRYREGVDASVRLGDAELTANRTVGLASMALLLDDRAEAERLLTDDVRRLSEREVQTVAYLATLEAWLAWPDAGRALRVWSRILDQHEMMWNGEVAGMALARVALRAGRHDLVERGTEVTLQAIRGATGPRMRLLRAAAEALREPAEPSSRALAAIGDGLAEAGFTFLAAEVDADAALLAARAGIDPLPLARRARERFAACGVVAPLGDPVEAVSAPGAAVS